MAYKQPRVPPMKEGTQTAAYLRELVLFLKDFCLETWQAVKTMQEAGAQQALAIEEEQAMREEIAAIRARVAALEARSA